MKRLVMSLGLMTLITYLFVGCSIANDSNAIQEQQTDDVEQTQEENKEETVERETEEITLAAVGDILIHDRVYHDTEVEGGYDFHPMLEPVEEYLKDPTITFANQETLIGGEEYGLSTYPAFNSPVEVGEALRDAGVDIVSTANNHTLDRGEDVIQGAIQNWEMLEMMYVGSYKDEEDRDELRIIETDEGISVGFVAYTYGTNGIPVPEGKDYLVNIIDPDRIVEDIDKMNEAADVVIVSMHFGDEDVRMPNEEQQELVQLIADEGADVVLGHHPHVLQPVEWIEGVGGNETLAIYSLGNFMSGQRDLYQKIGGVLNITITKTVEEEESTIDVHSPQFILTYNDDQDEQDYVILPWSDVTEEHLSNHEEIYDEMYEHMTQWMPELEFIE